MLIVMKFGGTSVADISRIKRVADRVEYEKKQGNKVVVVLSAMSGVTNKLVGYCEEVNNLSSNEAWAEYDSIVSTGENITVGLLALELQTRGCSAKSVMGWQLPIITEGMHGKARIKDIKIDNLVGDEVIIIPGFQGVMENGRIATLGRGGSDTSAVAIAAALNADRCDIYTDVDGVYTTDPRICSKARRIPVIGYEEMLELASLGSKVLQPRCVELGMKYNVPIVVRSSMVEQFDLDYERGGTLVKIEDTEMEKNLITGIAYSKNDVQITLLKVEDHPGVASSIFVPLAAQEVNVDMIIQNISSDGSYTDITFTIGKTDLEMAKKVLSESGVAFGQMLIDDNVAKVSIVGVGMKSHAGVASTMFKVLADKGINIKVISTSEIKISVLIASEYLELAVRSLHTAYGLE
jgi:aspartate kinase